MASGWESEGPGFKPPRLQAPFDPGLPKKFQQKYSQTYCVPFMIYFARRTLKDKKRHQLRVQPLAPQA